MIITDIVFSEQDVADELEARGIEASSENIEKVVKHINIRRMEENMIERGWTFIIDAVDKAEEEKRNDLQG